MTEVWLPVVGYEEYYLVNQFGDILSLRTNKLRKPVLNKSNGYLYVILCGKRKITAPIHRIVASAFLKNEHNFNVVNHKDENKLNNFVDNLEWCTQAYNNKYNNKDQRSCKKVVSKNIITGEEIIWPSARNACENGLANYKNISACCRGLRKSAGGFTWRYANG